MFAKKDMIKKESIHLIVYNMKPSNQVLGTVRNIFTIFLGAMFYTEVISLNEFLGYAVALTGFAFYNVAKSGMCMTVYVNA